MTDTTTDRYSTATLMETVRLGEARGRGSYREALILLDASVELRRAIVAEAWTRQNYQGGRWSDALQAASVDVKAGRTPYGDQAAAARRREAEAKEDQFLAQVAHLTAARPLTRP